MNTTRRQTIKSSPLVTEEFRGPPRLRGFKPRRQVETEGLCVSAGPFKWPFRRKKENTSLFFSVTFETKREQHYLEREERLCEGELPGALARLFSPSDCKRHLRVS